jgi:hypothetical protein
MAFAVAAQFYEVSLVRRLRYRVDGRQEANMRAEEGDESIDELADEAAKTKKELRESTETGEKVQKQQGHADRRR